MILSLQKYGVRKGLTKGLDRLKRCKIPNGGMDYP
jgi:putative component of membrane protein insertase Oxa1/YidC/SpoIIIJ protein YidD